MVRERRRAFVPYDEALEGFGRARKELNDLKMQDEFKFLKKFKEYKEMAKHEDAIAMDILAYYYKSGVAGALPENYVRYITWEFISASRGNELAIEKIQFLIGFACDKIIECPDYDKIKYKNDIDEYNMLYIIGKNLCKVIVREFLKAYPVDLASAEDDYQPYQQKYDVTLRRYIEESVQKTIDIMKS